MGLKEIQKCPLDELPDGARGGRLWHLAIVARVTSYGDGGVLWTDSSSWTRLALTYIPCSNFVNKGEGRADLWTGCSCWIIQTSTVIDFLNKSMKKPKVFRHRKFRGNIFFCMMTLDNSFPIPDKISGELRPSIRSSIRGGVAQWLAHQTCDPAVEGLIPTIAHSVIALGKQFTYISSVHTSTKWVP